MWIHLAATAFPELEPEPPATAPAIAGIERRLGVTVPADLRALLLETDGMRDVYESDVIWPAERIAADNAEFRASADFAELYQSFDELLFFGDNGGGDQFAYRAGDPAAGIFVWAHETDERRKVADDLADYLRRILTAAGDDEWYDRPGKA